MYIKSIVLDGFKSYKTRTEITGFDPEFNAITGLNGTGKSNVLDAICFVLGISNLTHVRAAQLQDLVFKNGQAGVTKATVSITFDNRHRSQCPTGYEAFDEITVTRQVIMGGKNKYMINGSNVQNKRVQDLFCSVQLNVNNPNFLIMQGRITKVLNMTPVEILALIEEAAGTHLYEVKKQEAKRLIAKKDAKLESLANMMAAEISPKLQKLKNERQQYLEFQRVEREKTFYYQLYVIHQLKTLQQDRQESNQNLENLHAEIRTIGEQTIENTKECEEIDEKIKELRETIDEESGGQLKELVELFKEKEKFETGLNNKVKSIQSNVAAQEKTLKLLQKSFKDDEQTLNGKKKELEKVQGLFSTLKEAQEVDEKALLLAEKRLEAASTGQLVGEDGEAATIQSQLMGYQNRNSEATTTIQQLQIEMKQASKQLAEKSNALKNTSCNLQQDKANIAEMEKSVIQKRRELENLQYDENRVNELNQRRTELTALVRNLRNKVEGFNYQHPRATFKYADPVPNFDRKRVYGPVCKLFKMKDPKHATALESTAGGKLYDIVIDSEQTGKMILEKGGLTRRVTFIPLNKVRPYVIDNSIIQAAQQLVGSDNVYHALSLITCDREVTSAMQYVFGSTLICANMQVATKVAFDRRIRTRCITLDGNSVDPSGVLTGGSKGAMGTLLSAVWELDGSTVELPALEQELENINRENQNFMLKRDRYYNLKQEYDLTVRKLEILKQQLEQTDHYQLKADVDNLTERIAQMKSKIQEAQEKEAQCKAKIREIENQLADVQGYQEKQLKDAQIELEKCRKKAVISKKEWALKEGLYETLTLEVSELEKALISGSENIDQVKTKLNETQEELADLKSQLEVAKQETKQLSEDVKTRKTEIDKKTKNVNQLFTKQKKLQERNQELKLEVQKRTLKLENLKSECQEWDNKEKLITKENSWVEGNTRSHAEYEALSEKEKKEIGTVYQKLKNKHHELERKVNKQALTLLETEEANYNNLMERKKTIEHDKNCILENIIEWDKKKKAAVVEAWKQVNKHFGSIFGSILPGSDAKLQPTDGKNVLLGLEVIVNIGGVWKKSLKELSGGQKSLIALSLILAMLLFKPAPLYILDEVDAALDLSHTQNIGNMLKTHFKHSQFIIVSLKDGMFNNANVLFRTLFSEGVSSITRTVCRQSK